MMKILRDFFKSNDTVSEKVISYDSPVMTSEAILVDIAENVGRNVKRGRNSFYSLPKTLSEDDDPFGLFRNPRQQQSVGEEELQVNSVMEKEEPNTGLLVQIETESPRISVSESFNSMSSRSDDKM